MPSRNPVRGEITRIQGDVLTMKTSTASFTFEIADASVSIDHLRVHLRDRLPVLITWRREGSTLVATLIADG